LRINATLQKFLFPPQADELQLSLDLAERPIELAGDLVVGVAHQPQDGDGPQFVRQTGEHLLGD
jgi:hypothetical protein